MVCLSGAGLPRLFWKKRPLNGCSSSSSSNTNGNTTELFLRAEDVEARLTDDLTEQLQQHVVVSLFN